jgi:hypothetical protein
MLSKMIIKRSLLVFAFTIGCLFQLVAQTVVCTKSKINGFDAEYDVGHRVCGDLTSDMNKAKLYLTQQGNFLYVHSNFLQGGGEFPAKIATSEDVNLETVFLNILSPETQSFSEQTKAMHSLYNDVEVIADPKMINNGNHHSVSFFKIKHLKFTCPDGIERRAAIIPNNEGAYDYLIKYNEQIYTRVKDQNLDFIFSQLKDAKINYSDLKIISLLDNSSTKEFINTSLPEKHIAFDFSSAENFKEILIQNRGNRIAIVGHIEEGNFITLNKAGQEIFKVSLEEIENIQIENNLELIILGCKSALEGSPSGPLNKFNSIDILKRLKTTSKTESVEEFLDSLSFRTVHFVLDQTFFRQRENAVTASQLPSRAEFSVYDNRVAELTTFNSKPIANIIFLGMGTLKIGASEAKPPGTVLPIADSAKDSSINTSPVFTPEAKDSKEAASTTVNTSHEIIAYIILSILGLGFIIFIFLPRKK